MIGIIYTPEPALIMELYPQGNIQDARVPDDQYVTAFAQILLGLSHLHKNGVAHRDLKPENFLVKKKPFSIAITDFGLSKVKDDNNLLKTFCGTLNHLAPEVFPGYSNNDSYGLEVDIWSAGVIMLEWMYNLPDSPLLPVPKRKGQQVTERQWRRWVDLWTTLLLEKLNDQEEDDLVAQILLGMIEPEPKKRWSADQCLKHGLQSGLFKMVTESRIVGSNDPDRQDNDEKEKEKEDKGDEGTKTPIARSPIASFSATRLLQITEATRNVEKTVLEGGLWGGGGSPVQRTKRARWKECDPNDLFRSNRLQHPSYVMPSVTALGKKLEE